MTIERMGSAEGGAVMKKEVNTLEYDQFFGKMNALAQKATYLMKQLFSPDLTDEEFDKIGLELEDCIKEARELAHANRIRTESFLV